MYSLLLHVRGRRTRRTACSNVCIPPTLVTAAATQCYVRDKEECDGLLRAIHTVPCVGKKAAWARRWIGDGDSCFAERLVAFACVEGIHFSGRCVQGGGALWGASATGDGGAL